MRAARELGGGRHNEVNTDANSNDGVRIHCIVVVDRTDGSDAAQLDRTAAAVVIIRPEAQTIEVAGHSEEQYARSTVWRWKAAKSTPSWASPRISPRLFAVVLGGR